VRADPAPSENAAFAVADGPAIQKGSGASVLLWSTFLERAELAGAGVCLHLLQQSNAATTGREIAFDLGVPFRLVALGEPSGQRCLLFFRQLLDACRISARSIALC